jgi:predicted amidophosphoribosyltransferase
MIRMCWNFVQPLLERPLCRRGGNLQKQKSTLKRKNDTRLVSILTSLYFKSFNKLLVLPNTTINFGPSTQREQHAFFMRYDTLEALAHMWGRNRASSLM